MDRVSSSQETKENDDETGEDDAGEDTLPTQSQPLLSYAWIEEDLAAIRSRLRCSYASASPVQSNTFLEVEMLRCQLS